LIYIPHMRSDGVWKKLNFRDHSEIVVLNAPDSFKGELAALGNVTVRTRMAAAGQPSFALAFGTKQAEVDAFAASLDKLADGDVIVWFAYPKGTSKRYTCEFNRDTGWTAIGARGFEPVRSIAIDEDWSALRFRRAGFIKEMTRPAEWAISPEGKVKAGNVKAGNVKASRARAGQARAGTAKAAKANAGRVRTGKTTTSKAVGSRARRT
jgi:hypothetical protein